MVIKQVSQWIDPEVHSRRRPIPQWPDPPAFPNFAEAWVVVIQLVYHCDNHVRLWECALPLKCSATVDSSVLVCMMLIQWPLTLLCTGCLVSPTYCWPHLLQVVKLIILEDLQLAANFILNFWPVLWLVNSSLAVNIGHVLQPAAPHGRLPGVSFWVAFRDAQTKKSLTFLWRWKAIKGDAGMYPVAVPMYVGLESGAWWSIQKMVKLDGMWPPAVFEQTCLGSVVIANNFPSI